MPTNGNGKRTRASLASPPVPEPASITGRDAKRIAACAAKEASRYAVTSIELSPLGLTATDGHILCVINLPGWPYPRLTAHLICESLGYATPTVAAGIILAAIRKQPHYCEWIYSCYSTQPLPAVHAAIHNRHHHRGYMAHYPNALQLVQHVINTGREPELASWF